MQEAKRGKLDLETEKMRLQKQMMELQLLMNADDQDYCEDLDNEDCQSDDAESPRIPAVKQVQLEELSMENSEHV
jgi:hypothetical protein